MREIPYFSGFYTPDPGQSSDKILTIIEIKLVMGKFRMLV